MYKRLSAVMFPVLAIVLVGSLVWGYQENQEKNSILIKAENQYQRAFHDLTYHIDQLHDELGNALVVNASSHAFHRKCLLNVWRVTSEAQSEISQLPLTLMPFHETSKFLANMANFSYQTAIKNFGEKPLSTDQIETMKSLYKQAEDVSKELRNVQSQAINQNLRWMDVELTLASEEKKMDNQIIDGFKSVDEKVGGFSEMSWGPSMKNATREQVISRLDGETVSPEEVQKKAAKFFGIERAEDLPVIENGKDTKMHTYSVTIPDKDGEPLNIDFSAKGGYMLWFMNPREIGTAQIDLLQAEQKALEFVEKRDFGKMAVINHDQYGGTASITMAADQDGIVLYPQKLIVNVAMDTGEITGLSAVDYVFENHDRKLSKPSLSKEDAEKSLNPDFKVNDHAVVLIKNDAQEEVICHQFTGEINGGLYRVYINGNDAQEEKIERLNTIEVQTMG